MVGILWSLRQTQTMRCSLDWYPGKYHQVFLLLRRGGRGGDTHVKFSGGCETFFFNQNLALRQINLKDFPSLFCDLKEFWRRKTFYQAPFYPPTLRVKQNLPYLIPKHIKSLTKLRRKGVGKVCFFYHIYAYGISRECPFHGKEEQKGSLFRENTSGWRPFGGIPLESAG